MVNQEEVEVETQLWRSTLSFVDSMALRSAVELGIPDIIHKHGGGSPLPLSRIAALLPSPSPPQDPSALLRLMRFLSHNRVFTSSSTSEGEEPHFGLTPLSSSLLRSSDRSLAPMLLLQTHPLLLAAWGALAGCIRTGATPFVEVNGMDLMSEAVKAVPEFGAVFHGAMACLARSSMEAVLSGYGGKGFEGVGTVVDVGGGTGATVAEIVRVNDGVTNGINFDLPFVVKEAPDYPGVNHVGGDAFDFVPRADAVFMKTVLHCFGDEECLRILQNCKNAIPKTGKVIIVDVVLYSNDDTPLGDVRARFDMMMLNYTSTGKERTEEEWRKLLKLAGFARLNIIKIPTIWSVIEAFLE